MRKISTLFKCGIIVAVIALPYGCKTAQEHRAAVQDGEGDRLTVGTVQREVRVGMSGAKVAEVLGSPNIVSTDEEGREVWIYDRISMTRVYSESRGGVSALVLGGALVGPALVGGAVFPYYGSSAGATETQQRTITVIIKFNEESTVRDFAYHASRF